MWDLQKEAKHWISELDSIGVPVGKIAEITYSNHLTSSWGNCKKVKKGNSSAYRIHITTRLQDASYNAFCTTLVHELLHASDDTKGHDARWKNRAEKANKTFGLHIKRTSSSEEKGIEETTDYKYELTCQKCGHVFRHRTACNSVKHPENYTCDCGGRLVLTKGSFAPSNRKPNQKKLRVYECEFCKARIVRVRESAFTRNYKKYTCGKCHGHFQRVKPSATEIVKFCERD